MNIISYSRTGYLHQMMNEDNQDFYSSYENEWMQMIILSDGASACSKAREGSQIAAEAAAEVVDAEGPLIFQESKERIASLIIAQIVQMIRDCKCESDQITDYGAVLIFTIIEKKTGKTLLFNLGDSAAIIQRGQKTQYLRAPENWHGHPCLTTTKDSADAVSIEKYKLKDGDQITLCSDGFLYKLQDNNIADEFINHQFDRLHADLKQNPPYDDCTYITCTWRRSYEQ